MRQYTTGSAGRPPLRSGGDLQSTERDGSETPLAGARLAVSDAEAQIELQRIIVFQLRREGSPSEEAEKALRALQDELRAHRLTLAQLENRERRGL